MALVERFGADFDMNSVVCGFRLPLAFALNGFVARSEFIAPEIFESHWDIVLDPT